MIVGEIELYQGSRPYLEQMWYPHALSQVFESSNRLPIVEYLCDLDRFQSEYLVERQHWLRNEKIGHVLNYISEPAEAGRGGKFTLVIAFHKASDAARYRTYWNNLDG